VLVYKEITTVTADVGYPYRAVAIPFVVPHFTSDTLRDQWMRDNWWMVDYAVFKDDKIKAVSLAADLDRAYEDKDPVRISLILDQLRCLRVKDANKRTALEEWTHYGYQHMSYCGSVSTHRNIVDALSAYQGDVLEALCGHTTYFEETAGRTVTLLDYCEVSLERHPSPSRRRICCDLNQVTEGVPLHFFKDSSFDVVSICFGFRYPHDIDALLQEFKRILKPGGVVSFVEGVNHGFSGLFKRTFEPYTISRTFVQNEYSSVTYKMVEEGLYHIQAIS
jgi:SAM-dependent methyltransferase